jgi:hypothetical protein
MGFDFLSEQLGNRQGKITFDIPLASRATRTLGSVV